jgi:hypothetical protein
MALEAAAALSGPLCASHNGVAFRSLHFSKRDESERKKNEKSRGAEIFRRHRGATGAAEIELKLHCARPGQEVARNFGGDADYLGASAAGCNNDGSARVEN